MHFFYLNYLYLEIIFPTEANEFIKNFCTISVKTMKIINQMIFFFLICAKKLFIFEYERIKKNFNLYYSL